MSSLAILVFARFSSSVRNWILDVSGVILFLGFSDFFLFCTGSGILNMLVLELEVKVDELIA